jgi:hypothetical protein
MSLLVTYTSGGGFDLTTPDKAFSLSGDSPPASSNRLKPVRDEVDAFTQLYTVTPAVVGTNPTIVTSVIMSPVLSGVSASPSGANTFTVQGMYQRNFMNKNYTVIRDNEGTQSAVYTFDQANSLPASDVRLVEYDPDETAFIEVNFTVATTNGVVQCKQSVNNDWQISLNVFKKHARVS